MLPAGSAGDYFRLAISYLRFGCPPIDTTTDWASSSSSSSQTKQKIDSDLRLDRLIKNEGLNAFEGNIYRERETNVCLV